MTDDAIRAAALRWRDDKYFDGEGDLREQTKTKHLDAYNLADFAVAQLDRPPAADDAAWARAHVRKVLDYVLDGELSVGTEQEADGVYESAVEEFAAELLDRLSRRGTAADDGEGIDEAFLNTLGYEDKSLYRDVKVFPIINPGLAITARACAGPKCWEYGIMFGTTKLSRHLTRGQLRQFLSAVLSKAT